MAVAGKGPALVLVDGAMSSQDSRPSAPGLEDALSEKCTVVRYDRRGRGRSDMGAAGVNAEVQDLAAIIEDVGGEAALCGFSSGAILALEAARAGLPVTRLALYEPPCVVTDDREPVPADYPERVSKFVDEGEHIAALALFMIQPVGMPAAVVEQMSADPDFQAGAASARSLPFDAQVMAAVSTGNADSLRRYSGVHIPVLVMSGSATEPWLTESARAVRDALPDAHHGVVEDQGHDPSADSILPALRSFMRL